MNMFPHKPALVVFDSYYFSTGSLSRFNSPVSDGEAGYVVKTKFIGAERKDRLPVTDAMVGRVNCRGEWDGMFISAENLLLIHLWEVDQNVGRKF